MSTRSSERGALGARRRGRRLRWALAAVLAGALAGGGTGEALAGGWTFLPVKEEGFRAQPTLALTGGWVDPDTRLGGSAGAYGAELSFNCLLLQPPRNRIRTTLSYMRYDDQGLKLNDFELNPHYVVELSERLWVGGGPGIGLVKADTSGEDATMLAFQLGASLHYRLDRLFLGAEARYQITQSDRYGPAGNTDSGVNNFRVLAKVGLNL